MRPSMFCDKMNTMNTELLRITDARADADAIRRAGEVIQRGGLVAFPTETVYGLGADAFNADAAKRIYAAKGRPSDNPLIVHIADIASLERLARDIPEAARELAERYWPGPLTMIFHKREELPSETTGGRDTVAVRYPDNACAQALITAAGGYIAAPSANVSGKPSPTNGADVMEDLDGRVDIVLDDGATVVGLESTIIDMTCEPPEILRPGAVTYEQIKEIIPKAALHAADDADEARAPGMKYRHYAPKAPLHLCNGAVVVDQIQMACDEDKHKGLRTGVLTCTENAPFYRADCVQVLGSERDPAGMAQRLYACLREFDRAGVDVIYSETFTEQGIGQALMNRLTKAADD